MAYAFPLQWPQGYKRTDSWRRTKSQFKATFENATEAALHELCLMDARNIVITTNVPITKDGYPYAELSRRRIDDPGVAVYFQRKGKSMVLACDRWSSTAENLRAIALSVAAMRGLDRWGVSDMLDRAFTGFTALPAPPKPKPWWEVLGVTPGARGDIVRARYRELAVKHHPDRGGDPAMMAAINRAYEEAQKTQAG